MDSNSEKMNQLVFALHELKQTDTFKNCQHEFQLLFEQMEIMTQRAYNLGKTEGYDAGKENGYRNGYADGDEHGYFVGYDAAKDKS